MFKNSKTTELGPDGCETSFFIDENLDNNPIYIKIQEENNIIQISNINKTWMPDATFILPYIQYTNNILNQIYNAHKLISEENINLDKIIDDFEKNLKKIKDEKDKKEAYEINNQLEYIKRLLEKSKQKQNESLFFHIRIQNLVGMLKRILLLFVFASESRFILNHKKQNHSLITNLREFLSKKEDLNNSDIYKNVIKSPTSEELFNLIEVLDYLYQSQYMLGTTRIFSSSVPKITAIQPYNKDNYKYIFHNHSIYQIICAFNNLLTELEFFNG